MNPMIKIAAPVALCLSVLRLPATAAPEPSSLWQVKSATNTIYLAGSLPLLREGDQPLPPQFERAYQASKRLVFEVDPEETNDEGAGQRAIKAGMFGKEGSLKDSVSGETYEQLGDFLESTGAPRAAMDQFRPWFAAVVVSMTEMMKLGARPDLGVARVLEDRAVKDGKPTSGLEKMEVEMRLLADLPKAAHEHMLKSTLEDIGDREEMEKELDEFVAAWRAGDVETLAELDAEDDSEWNKLLNEKLVHDRSAKWVKSIEEVLAGDEATLYVVGIGHLVGEKSLIELLAANGYQIDQLKGGQPAEDKNDNEEKEKIKNRPALIPVSLHRGQAGC